MRTGSTRRSSRTCPAGGEFGYDVTLPQFRAIVVKAGTDPKIVKKLADELAKISQNAEFKAYLDQQYADPEQLRPHGERAQVHG